MDRQKISLFLLRWGLGLFLLIWGIDKLIDPAGTVKIFGFFYQTPISIGLAHILGMLEIFLALLILAGLWKKWTYGTGLLLHTVSMLASIKNMLPGLETYDHLFVAAFPVFTAFIALFLLRDEDTLFTLKDPL